MAIKTRQDLINEYISFFTKKKHKLIPNASLVPANDPTVLFTTAGMHPLVPYLTGQKHPLGKRLVNVQKCIRTVDIDEVGDKTHHTFFEMLGNWSLGDYWKKESIQHYYKFLTKTLKISKERLAFTCFKGDADAPKDFESEKTLLSLGISKDRISFYGKEDNWWGPAGEIGPCGTDIEIFFWKSEEKPPIKYDQKNKNWVEIGTDVFLEYEKTKQNKFLPLKQKNIDFGGGVERTLSILNNLDDNYLSSTFLPIIKQIEKISHKSYEDNKYKKQMRIIADHIKAAVMIISSGILPSNTEHGYILRRLIRRAIRYGKLLNIEINFTNAVALSVFPIYPDYKDLQINKDLVLKELKKEENKFKQTVERGIRLFNKISSQSSKNHGIISGKDAFLLFQSYGFPIEMTEEMAKEKNIKVDTKGFHQAYLTHQKLSRTASSGRFKSGLADHSEITTRLHTATHMLNEAMQRILGPKVAQRGSNITPERTRFDFTFDRKLTEQEISEIENLINKKVKAALHVVSEEMPLKKAFASGAKGEFGHKYPNKVFVYTIVDKKEKSGYFSKEICTGPHVTNTSKIGHFKIIKQQSVSAGVRRIKAIVK